MLGVRMYKDDESHHGTSPEDHGGLLEQIVDEEYTASSGESGHSP